MIRGLTYDQFCNRCYRLGLSNAVFAQLHPSVAVTQWAELDGIEEEWTQLASIYERVIETGRSLDAYVHDLVRAEIPIPALTRSLLHRGYFAAFRASRIKGSVDRLSNRA